MSILLKILLGLAVIIGGIIFIIISTTMVITAITIIFLAIDKLASIIINWIMDKFIE